MIYRLLVCCVLALSSCPVFSQQEKMSAFIRQLASRQHSSPSSKVFPPSSRVNAPRGSSAAESEVCAFVRIEGGQPERVLSENGCRSLAHWGDIHIAMIPLSSIDRLAAQPAVSRIEARRSCHLLMDTTALCVNALPVYEGNHLQQAYTGRGVVMGVMDIGFDLTHPNFYSADLSDYRIRRFWDQLDLARNDTLPVGSDYDGADAILAYAHSRDGLDQTHGTHTLGIAAGSGYDSPYRGMAFESDICLVANATTEDIALIDSTELYKYTSATDALGFKYIFDYAQSVGQPCVISFSEGGPQGFSDEERLFYEVLDSLTGPGRILVAAAGNSGDDDYYVQKPVGKELAGTYIFDFDKDASFAARGDSPYTVRVVAYMEGEEPDTLLIHPFSDALAPDTIIHVFPRDVTLKALCYRSFYNPQDMAVEVGLSGPDSWKALDWIGMKPEFSIEVIGEDAEVELLLQDGYFLGGVNYDVVHEDAEPSHSIHSPGAAPSVICVGASSHRTAIRNYEGAWRIFDMGTNGRRADFSSVGPTFDGRIKPDVMAPGTNIISSYSSFYCETHPNASDIASNVSLFDFNGRSYAWNSNAGTSMATPVVAGAIALWLQAKPDLSPQQALDVISRTARHYTDSLAYPNNYYGYGEIDVYEGLLAVLELDVVDGISHHHPASARISVASDRQLVVSQCKEPVTVRIFNLKGQSVLTLPLNIGEDGRGSVSLQSLPAGVYVVQLNGSPAVTGSTLVRL